MLKSPLTFRAVLENCCVFLSILSAVVLLIVWALADTIAARNISIVTGLLASSIWVLLVRPKITRLDLIVPALLMGVPIWLWAIYFFFSIDPVAQYKEMTGTWLRVILLIIFGFNLGLMISKKNRLIIWIWMALGSVPISALAIHMYMTNLQNISLVPNYAIFFKTKIAGVYFLIWPCLLGYAGIYKALLDWERKIPSLQIFLISTLSVSLVFVCFYVFYVLHALNGFLISFFCFLLLLIYYAKHLFLSSNFTRRFKFVFISFIFLLTTTAAVSYWKYDQSHEQKLTHLVSDIWVASNIDQSSYWVVMQGSGYSTSKRQDGSSVNLSTYTRVSWFLKGLEYLRLHPLGSGDVNFGFGQYMRSEYPGSQTTKTHSGWLDFALGVGLPGLLMCWSAIYATLVGAAKAGAVDPHKFMPMAIFGMMIGVWVLWWPGELSYREFIEHYFFMIIIFSACFYGRSISGNMLKGAQ